MRFFPLGWEMKYILIAILARVLYTGDGFWEESMTVKKKFSSLQNFNDSYQNYEIRFSSLFKLTNWTFLFNQMS